MRHLTHPDTTLTWYDYRTYRAEQGHNTDNVQGNLRILPQLWSPQCQNKRDILVYLPQSYPYSSERRYPVLYMHDGQNLFDAETSFAGKWQVDEAMEKLAHERREAIIVGLNNVGEARLAEYTPFPDPKHGGGQGDDYLDFVINTVKPIIDDSFRTRLDAGSTGIMGSSLGGLISLYAFFKHPDVFGRAGVMSASLWFAKEAIFDFVKKSPYNPGNLYVDTGTHEYNGFWSDRVLFRVHSRRHCARTRRMVNYLRRRGYTRQQLHYLEDLNAEHTESAWARRFPTAMRFLFNPIES
jgi:predicted alpha/beta superfamily hydrolase